MSSLTVKVFTDYHFYSPYSLPRPQLMFHPSENYILLGDIVDFVNCREEELSQARALFNMLNRLYGQRYVHGNHELSMSNLHFKLGRTLFVHGDFETWGEERAKKYRAKKPASKLRALKKVFEFFPGSDLDAKELDLIAAKAQTHGCEMVIMGHSHPKNIKRYNHKGVVVYHLPRGEHDLTVLA